MVEGWIDRKAEKGENYEEFLPCPVCKGCGYEKKSDEEYEPCPVCKGRGYVKKGEAK